MGTSIAEMEKRIAQLNALIEPLNALIEPLTDERAELNQKIIELKSSFKVGDIIEWNDRKRKGRVVRIQHWCCGDPMWLVRRIRQDGREGEECDVRSYQKPALAP